MTDKDANKAVDAVEFVLYAVPILATQSTSFCWRCRFRLAWGLHLIRKAANTKGT